MKAGVLYLSYDGMLEPLGQSQVLAYLKGLSGERPIHLISFEKPSDWADAHARGRLAMEIAEAGIRWHPLTYHKRPSALATAWDIAAGIVLGLVLSLRYRLRIFHARSYVAAVMALALKRLTGGALLFDMRGFWADERVDGGLWPPASRLYAVAKNCERRLLLAADHVVSLTRAAVDVMAGFDYLQGRLPPITVIPTCADLNRFQPPAQRPEREGFVLGCVGSVGTWYLLEEMAACFAQLLRLRPDARILIVNRGEHRAIRQALFDAGVPGGAVELVAAAHAEVPKFMARMDAGLFFIKPAFSKQASAPTKLAEFLGCGIPCLGNAGIGDTAAVLEGEGVGVVLRSFDADAMVAALNRLMAAAHDPAVRQRCRDAAQRQFSLAVGIDRYRKIYDRLDA